MSKECLSQIYELSVDRNKKSCTKHNAFFILEACFEKKKKKGSEKKKEKKKEGEKKFKTHFFFEHRRVVCVRHFGPFWDYRMIQCRSTSTHVTENPHAHIHTCTNRDRQRGGGWRCGGAREVK